MGTFSLTVAVAEAEANAIATQAGTSPSIIIYSGTAPASARASLSGNTVLATLACSSTPFPSATDDGSANAVLTFNTITSATAAATGTATFWRLLKSDGTTVICQGSVSSTSGEMVLNTTAITSGSTVSLTGTNTIKQPYGP